MYSLLKRFQFTSILRTLGSHPFLRGWARLTRQAGERRADTGPRMGGGQEGGHQGASETMAV